MANVYGNSSCNTMATSRDSHKDCFKRCNPLTSVPCPVCKSNGFHIFAQKNDSPVRKDAPLLTRAWVFHEYILAPRNVYFSDSILYWHCRGRLSWEENPPRGELYSHLGMDYGKAPFERMLRGDKGESNQEFAERMVPARAYTEVRLSFEKDCLIPLSG
jgi:hypothetical protein